MNILFIGNSYTFKLPETLTQLAKAHDKTVSYTEVTTGGWTLKQHAESQETLAAIRTGGWDYVVLQEQSQIPSFAEHQRAVHLYPYATKLHETIRETAAETLFYLTWGHANGDRRNIPDDSFANMQQRLQQGYENAAKRCAAAVIPVGTAWAEVRAQDASVDLYQRDGSHPNAGGVYLNACVFFRFLFQTDIQHGLRFSDQSVSDAEAAFIERIANSLSLTALS